MKLYTVMITERNEEILLGIFTGKRKALRAGLRARDESHDITKITIIKWDVDKYDGYCNEEIIKLEGTNWMRYHNGQLQ